MHHIHPPGSGKSGCGAGFYPVRCQPPSLCPFPGQCEVGNGPCGFYCRARAAVSLSYIVSQIRLWYRGHLHHIQLQVVRTWKGSSFSLMEAATVFYLCVVLPSPGSEGAVSSTTGVGTGRVACRRLFVPFLLWWRPLLWSKSGASSSRTAEQVLFLHFTAPSLPLLSLPP